MLQITMLIIVLIVGAWTGAYWTRREVNLIQAVNNNTATLRTLIERLNTQATLIQQLQSRVGAIEAAQVSRRK